MKYLTSHVAGLALATALLVASPASAATMTKEVFDQLTPKERIAFVQSALQTREKSLSNFYYDMEVKVDGALGARRSTWEHGRFQMYWLNNAYLLHAQIAHRTKTGEATGNVTANWDGRESRAIVPPNVYGNDANIPRAGITNSEPEDVREIVYNNLLGLRVGYTPAPAYKIGVPPPDIALSGWIAAAVTDGAPLEVTWDTDEPTPRIRIAALTGGSLLDTYWLDVTKDYMPSRFDHRSQTQEASPKVIGETTQTVDEAKQVDGVWVPFKATRITGLPVNTERPISTYTYTIKSFTRNTVKVQDLVVTFPVGTGVVDNVHHRAYILRQDGADYRQLYDPTTGNVLPAAATQGTPPATTAPAATPESQPGG